MEKKGEDLEAQGEKSPSGDLKLAQTEMGVVCGLRKNRRTLREARRVEYEGPRTKGREQNLKEQQEPLSRLSTFVGRAKGGGGGGCVFGLGGGRK